MPSDRASSLTSVNAVTKGDVLDGAKVVDATPAGSRERARSLLPSDMLLRIRSSPMSSTSIAKHRPLDCVFVALAFAGAVCGGGLAIGASHLGTPLSTLSGMALGVMLGVAGARRVSDRSTHVRRAPAGSLGDLLAHCEDALVLTDRSLRIVYANEAFAALCGHAVAAATGRTIADVLTRDATNDVDFVCALGELAEHPEREACGEFACPATPARSLEWRTAPLREADGSVSGRGFLFHDRSQMRELAGLKSDFLSTVTHELRTPLTSVKGSLQLVLGKSAALSPLDSELLHISLKNADRLIRLINDLLDISRLELGKIELTIAKVETKSLIDEAVAGLRAYAAAREIAIEVSAAPGLAAVAGDRDRLIQVLTNLISNAVKFSPAGATVDVIAHCESDGVRIAVRDRGIGIPIADQCRLFQRFQRLHPGHSGEPGSGLGLAISKAIVDRHGGRIMLDSREQEGSTFTVVLPVVHEPPQILDARARSRASEDKVPLILLIGGGSDVEAMLQNVWTSRYRLTSVRGGAEALDTARRIHPDVVILDAALVDLSAHDVLCILHTAGVTAAIPVIMLGEETGKGRPFDLGVTGVVAKPVDVVRLTLAVDQVLSDRRADESPRFAVGG